MKAKIINIEIFKDISKMKKYIKKYYILFILNIILAMISSLVSSAPLALVKRLFDKGIVGQNEKDIIYASSSMIGLAVIGAVLIYWNTIFSADISTSIYKDIVNDVYKKVQKLDMEYFSETKIGDLMVRVSSDPGNINLLIREIFNIIPEIFRALVLFGIALYVDWKLTIGVMLGAPLLMFVVKRYSKKLKRTGRERQEASSELNNRLQETLLGIRVIKSFATEDKEIERFNLQTEKVKRISLKTAKYNAKSSAISEAMNYVMVAILLFFGGMRVILSNNFTAGDFITVIGAISSMYTPIKRSINRYNEISLNLPSIGRVSEILEIQTNINNIENPVIFKEFKNDIIFENVSFNYKNQNIKALKNINLKVNKGEKIALVGNSGGGKTTFINLIPRFFDVTEGSIKIDDIDIKEYEIESLRRNIGIVPQETFLFAGTVYDNIKYANENATDEEVFEAAKKANAHEFILQLENGYETEIGERGVKLSGGQKQRIAIARAIIENPEILILDEATSALDNESEKLVQDALEKLMENKTTFIIAHRLTTIEHCDKIVVLQRGKIKEIGTHEELMNKQSLYYNLYTKNFDSENK